MSCRIVFTFVGVNIDFFAAKLMLNTFFSSSIVVWNQIIHKEHVFSTAAENADPSEQAKKLMKLAVSYFYFAGSHLRFNLFIF